MAGSASGAAREVIVASARQGEPDRYLAALLAPLPARAGLLALAAFLSELQRVAWAVREPAMGMIRLQWWRDALQQPEGTRTGSPIADAVRKAARAHALPANLLNDLIDVRLLDLEATALLDEAALQSYLWKSEGVAFLLAAHMLGARSLRQGEEAATTGARAYGLARLLLALPLTLSRGRLPLPLRHLAAGKEPKALLAGAGGAELAGLLSELCADSRRHHAACRQHVAKLPRKLRPAFLPLALVEPYLRRLERAGGEPLGKHAGIAPLVRVLRIAAAHGLGRL